MSRDMLHPGAALPRTAPQVRRRLLLVLALAAAVALLLLRARAPVAPRERSPDAATSMVPAEPPAAAPPASAEVPVVALRVSVRDQDGRALGGARCEVTAWNAVAESDAFGFARIPAPGGAPAEVTVRASREGYRPASRRGRLLGEHAVELKLLKAPPIRVLDEAGEQVADFSWDAPGADLRERTLRARGYLSLDLAELPHGLLLAWDDLLGRTPVDIFLVSDQGLGCAVLRVDTPGGAPVTVGIDATSSALPDLSPRLEALPFEWRRFYAARWQKARVSPGPTGAVREGDEIRVYAEGTLVVHCIGTDCRPLRQEIDVAAGAVVARTLTLARETWADQEILVTDCFGREGPLAVRIVEPVFLALVRQDRTLRVPRGGGPYALRADGGARGFAVQKVETLPSQAPIRFELAGIEVRLRLVDDESGEPIEGLGLSLEGSEVPVVWRSDEGAYVFGPVDPGTVGVVHDPEHRIDLRIDPGDAEKGILRRELRVRGFPGSVPQEAD
jgi:hypothetical protein